MQAAHRYAAQSLMRPSEIRWQSCLPTVASYIRGVGGTCRRGRFGYNSQRDQYVPGNAQPRYRLLRRYSV